MEDETAPVSPDRTSQPLRWIRATDFEEKYANNVRSESSVWDLRLLFGNLDQGAPDPAAYPNSVKFHTAITVPWAQVKLMIYQLSLAVLFQELSGGPIDVPASIRPPQLLEAVPALADDPNRDFILERVATVRALLFND